MMRFLTYLITLLTSGLLAALVYTVFSVVYFDVPLSYHFCKQTTNETLNYSLVCARDLDVSSTHLLFGSSMALNNFLLEKVEEHEEFRFHCIGGWGVPPSGLSVVMSKLPEKPQKIFIPISLNECNRSKNGEVIDKDVTTTSPLIEALDPKSLKRTLKYCGNGTLSHNNSFRSILFNKTGNIPLARFFDGFKKDQKRYDFQYNPELSICHEEMELVMKIAHELAIEIVFLLLPFRTQETEYLDFQKDLSALQLSKRFPIIDLRAADIPTEHWLDKTHLDSIGARILSEHFKSELLRSAHLN